ncbi:SDR family NAD(P)-dependent oxidoreductase [Lacisediminihabitans profunda]|uniref:SDR family oxidoreductase n=1 Tax=Lacisediminihabitans profunda TaxID=2594790 RepID=A0A5C8UJW6_9MICO|nr:SDR family oxidoreductase [Lacisediminihabitans profunda]TXN28366.1 SDR family oxidoreductase [Lacisediminihabitans profunda]
MSDDTKNAVAVVTGAAGGLGRVITRVLLEDGFRVAAIDIGRGRLDEAFRDEIGSGDVLALECDITDEAAVARTIARVDDTWLRLDALINNAGIEPQHSIRDADMTLWDQTFAVNVRAPMMLVKHATPIWERQQRGTVVCIGSRTWQSGSSTASYGASKAALVGLVRSIASELGPIGVNANVVAPSFVRTPLNAIKGDHDYIDDYAARFTAISAMRRLIEPIDVANAVAFLASPRARNITGDVINVAAGSHMPPTIR